MVSEKTKKVKEAPKKFEWQIGESHYYVDKSIVRYTVPTKNPLATPEKS